MILDDATKEPPADPDAVFVPELPYGSNRVCQYRLVERTFLGPHSSPIERLLLPEGDPTLLGRAPARPDRMHAALQGRCSLAPPLKRGHSDHKPNWRACTSRHTPTLKPATAWKNSTRWHAPAISGLQSWPAPSIN
ncbi:hypothetical protein [Streptomyces cinereospinus]|uniref:Uncharacterized protein n=1 Tax=Streptomyces cinereospinus TaxID=285561 RepID=A0ABV5NAH5_9ACTN